MAKISLSKDSKNTSVDLSLESRGEELTWEDADMTWDEQESIWERQKYNLTKDSKSSISLTLGETK